MIPLEAGDIIQLNPETCRNSMLAGCFLVVTEPKQFGCQGYVQCTGKDGEAGGQAYYRPVWEEIERTGAKAPFVIEDAS